MLNAQYSILRDLQELIIQSYYVRTIRTNTTAVVIYFVHKLIHQIYISYNIT